MKQYKLSYIQRMYLEKLISYDIVTSNITGHDMWENIYRPSIVQILHNGSYIENDKGWLNNIHKLLDDNIVNRDKDGSIHRK